MHDTELNDQGVTKQWLSVQVEDTQSFCNSQNNHNGKVLPEMFCAKRSTTMNAVICPPTRGGAIYCREQPRYILGVLTFGFGCDRNDIPPVFIQVSHIFIAFGPFCGIAG